MDQELKEIQIGSWEVIREGTDIALLSFGPTLQDLLSAADKLEKEGISARVINARFIKPLDEKMIADLMQEGLPMLTVEEAI
ncbi:transketolase C-terminal domain-containing protein, partial [Planococcus sp. SIMBA_143]